MFLKVKENLRQQGISTKGELSQLAVLLHELVLQVLFIWYIGTRCQLFGKRVSWYEGGENSTPGLCWAMPRSAFAQV